MFVLVHVENGVHVVSCQALFHGAFPAGRCIKVILEFSAHRELPRVKLDAKASLLGHDQVIYVFLSRAAACTYFGIHELWPEMPQGIGRTSPPTAGVSKPLPIP